MKELTIADRHDDAKSFNDDVQYYLKKLDKIMKTYSEKAPSKKGFLGWFKKSFNPVTNIPLPGDPGFSGKTPGASANDATSAARGMTVNRYPGMDPRYKYKAFGSLTDQEKLAASHAFGERDMHDHLYPVDESGALVHGTRWRAPAQVMARMKSAPQAGSKTPVGATGAPKIPPQHKRGAAVKINAPGHPLHGQFGIVELPNPSMPNKISVRVRQRGIYQNAYVDPHQVSLSREAPASSKTTAPVPTKPAGNSGAVPVKKSETSKRSVRSIKQPETTRKKKSSDSRKK